jgi:hypothetical protein
MNPWAEMVRRSSYHFEAFLQELSLDFSQSIRCGNRPAAFRFDWRKEQSAINEVWNKVWWSTGSET